MTGNGLIDKILILILVVVTGGTLGLFVYTEILYEKPLPHELDQKKQLLEDQKALSFTNTFKLDKMTINLKSKTKRLRFLDTQINLMPFKNEFDPIIEAHKSEIVDIIIDIAGHMSPAELNSISGKILLEDRIKKRINKMLDNKVIKSVLFSKYVVQ